MTVESIYLQIVKEV